MPGFTPRWPPPEWSSSPEFSTAHPATARSFADKYGTRAFASIEEAAEASDALNIVTPTTTHVAIARGLIERGKHLLIEKPMTDDMQQGADLVQLAHERGCLVQVGHIERFNPVFISSKQWPRNPASLNRIGSRHFPAAVPTWGWYWT